MTHATRSACITRLLADIATVDRDAEELHATGEHLRAEEKRIEGMALRRALRRFTEPTDAGRYRLAGAGVPQ